MSITYLLFGLYVKDHMLIAMATPIIVGLLSEQENLYVL